jgi:hypothetical protein
VTPEERAKAVVTYFPSIPPKIRADVEAIITRAIRRALDEQLSALEKEAEDASNRWIGRGKQNKFGDPDAVKFHMQWAEELRRLRTGKDGPREQYGRHWRDLDLSHLRKKWHTDRREDMK